jgi:hypothetical protein
MPTSSSKIVMDAPRLISTGILADQQAPAPQLVNILKQGMLIL